MRKHAFALLLSVIVALAFVPFHLAIAAKNNTTIFSDGFESGDFSAWDGTTVTGAGTVNVEATIPHLGTYSMKSHSAGNVNDAAYAYKNVAAMPVINIRTYVYFTTEALGADGERFIIISINGLFGLVHYTVQRSGGVDYFGLHIGPTAVLSTIPVQTGVWYSCELEYDSNTQITKAYLNGTEILNYNSSPVGNADFVYIGLFISDAWPAGWQPSTAINAYFDDVVVADSYIGPIPDTATPTFESFGTSTNVAGSSCTFNSLTSDDTNVSTYIFSTNNTGTWTNDTATAFSNFYNSTTAWANVTKTLNDTTGNTVSYLWYANDTSDNWGTSDQHNLTLTAPYTPGLQLTPTNQTRRIIDETFTLNLTMSDAENTTQCDYEIHYNATLLNCTQVTWLVWTQGQTIIDLANGTVTGTTFGNPLNGNQTLIQIHFTTTFLHIWKQLPNWTNDLTDIIFIQSANLTSTTHPDSTYIRNTINQINIGPDVNYTYSPIQGDVNNGGTVDVIDLRTVAIYFGQINDTYNLVGDSTIDIFDLRVIAQNVGYTYQP